MTMYRQQQQYQGNNGRLKKANRTRKRGPRGGWKRKVVSLLRLYLTSFISHNEDGGGRSQALGIEHLYRDQVLRVRLQVVDLVALQRQIEKEYGIQSAHDVDDDDVGVDKTRGERGN